MSISRNIKDIHHFSIDGNFLTNIKDGNAVTPSEENQDIICHSDNKNDHLEEVDKKVQENEEPCNEKTLEDFSIDGKFYNSLEEFEDESKVKAWKQQLQNLSRKTSNIFDVTPHNSDIVDYCKALINLNFQGQCEIKRATSRLSCLLHDPTELTLSMFLQSMDTFLRSFGSEEVFGDEEEFLYFMQGLLEKRNIENVESFWNDAKRFLKLYKQRGFRSEELNHLEYWGTRQQLLSGKIIADFIDSNGGPLDPVFGVLLCPVAGRAGPGDSGVVHTILFDVDGPLAYHSAVHDAFGYLLTFHGVGPGYNYVGAGTILNSMRCMSGQISGLYFWREILKHKASFGL